jgi:hypothetical protein
MLTNSLIIGNAPDYAMRLGNTMIRHQMRVIIRVNGRKERPRTLSNFSLAGLKNTIDSIIKPRAPGGVLVRGRTVFGVMYLPKNKFHMMIHPKWNELLSEKDVSNLKPRYIRSFFNLEETKV